MRTWWLSFADPELPGTQFLGVAIVEAHNMIAAVKVAHALGINPGGEVKGAPLPADLASGVPKSYRDRLLSIDECKAVDALMGGPGKVTRDD